MKKIISVLLSFCLIFTMVFTWVQVPYVSEASTGTTPIYKGITFGEQLYPVVGQADITTSGYDTTYWSNSSGVTSYDAQTGALETEGGSIRTYSKLTAAKAWTNYMWESDIVLNGANSTRFVGLQFLATGNSNGYVLGLSTTKVALFDVGIGNTVYQSYPIQTVDQTHDKTTAYHVSVVIYDGVIYCYVDYSLVMQQKIDGLAETAIENGSTTMFNEYTAGSVGFAGFKGTYTNYNVMNVSSFDNDSPTDGYVYFEDNFEDGTSHSAWSTNTKEANGKIAQDSAFRLNITTLTELTDYAVEADISYTGNGGGTASKGTVSLTARNTDGSNKNIIEYGIGATGQNTNSPTMGLFFSERIGSSTPTQDVKIPYSGTLTAGTEYHMKLIVIGTKAYCYFENECVYVTELTKTGNAATLAKGRPGVNARIAAGTCDNFKVTHAVLTEATGVTLDRSEMTIDQGASSRLIATITPANATDQMGIWSSSDTSVATVEAGVVTGEAPGRATITVSCGTCTASCTVTVKEVVYIPEFQDDFEDGTKHEAWGNDTYENGGKAILEQDGVASRSTILSNLRGASTWTDYTVEADVVYTGAGSATTNVGAVYVGARCKGQTLKTDMVGFGIGEMNRKTDGMPMLIFREYVNQQETVKIISYEGELYPNLENRLKLTVIDDTAYCYLNGEFVYKTKISVAGGTAGVYAINAQGIADNFCVSPAQNIAVEGIKLSRDALLLSPGKTSSLTVVTTPFDATNDNVFWSSDNEGVATVNEGVITAVSSGKATITAISEEGGYIATCIVNVTEGLLFYDDFEGAAMDRAWSTSSTVSYANDGLMTLGLQASALLNGISEAVNWTDYTVEAELIYNDAGTSTTNSGFTGVMVYTDGTKTNGFFFGIGQNTRQTSATGAVIFVNVENGQELDKYSTAYNIVPGVSYRVKVEAYDSMLYCYVDGNLVYVTQNDSHTLGVAGLNTRNCTGFADSFEVTVSEELAAFKGKEPEKEIWFKDDFSDSESFITERGWSHGNVAIQKGSLVLNNEEYNAIYLTNVLDSNVWKNYVVTADLRISEELMKNSKSKNATAGIVARTSGTKTGIEYRLVIPESGKKAYLELYNRENKTVLGSCDMDVSIGDMLSLKMIVSGNQVYGFCNGKRMIQSLITDGTAQAGAAGLLSLKNNTAFDNVVVRKINTSDNIDSKGMSPSTGDEGVGVVLPILFVVSFGTVIALVYNRKRRKF